MKKKVAVAMSGGVDSSVTAYLLKEAGYDVEGFFLRLKFPHCLLSGWRESEGRAYLAAKELGIPIRILDLSKNFETKIWDPLWANYMRGLTSNPCPSCNPQIKFGLLFDKVIASGFSYLATGHYVRVIKEEQGFELRRGIDRKKDQSYFLYGLNKKILPQLLFPLGELEKPEVKKIAQKIFPNRLYRTAESQGLCFTQGEDFRKFMHKILPKNEGNIVNEKGSVIGKHQGAWFYTEGQRSGIGNIKTSNKFIYVVKKINQKNELVVSSNSELLFSKSCKIKNINWLDKPIKKTFKAAVQLRYGAPIVKIEANCNTNMKNCELIFKTPQRAVTPGQSAVFYKGDQVLGGGEISLD